VDSHNDSLSLLTSNNVLRSILLQTVVLQSINLIDVINMDPINWHPVAIRPSSPACKLPIWRLPNHLAFVSDGFHCSDRSCVPLVRVRNWKCSDIDLRMSLIAGASLRNWFERRSPLQILPKGSLQPYLVAVPTAFLQQSPTPLPFYHRFER
jgi:hypothetical protein